MDSMGSFASSGLTITLSPVQLFVGAGLLGIACVANAKSLLFAWHGRLFLQLARHFSFRRNHLTVRHGGEGLFAPVVTSSYTPLLDIDYNLHKSNSTFFSDLDDNRTELMLALFKDVVKPIPRGDATTKPKMFNLGGTSCIFKKAVAPFAKYEISSRVLCWDQKWIYVVSHFTKPGSSNAGGTIMGHHTKKTTFTKADGDCIYATAITKYVFKQGRVTCSPESVMHECSLLPPQPTTEGSQGLVNGIASPAKELGGHWTWDQVQEERTRYLNVAENFAALDSLHETFVGHSGPILYAY
ncbi:hypothetical protein EK21DRAFT_113900 [Setomelanomma holmii]|uniref:Capsule polysaccharide biosynthesis protein n=1 Tax=Setomelanomma holmii TaxID=210430 RepID=A0A9P4H668_9PLEO|nr:hypothetical protein EK21DRAFT_113900 [Setomelanomma holmii]